eukprot:560760-Lingulodinium_polyedra.AAC.1
MNESELVPLQGPCGSWSLHFTDAGKAFVSDGTAKIWCSQLLTQKAFQLEGSDGIVKFYVKKDNDTFWIDEELQKYSRHIYSMNVENTVKSM